MYRHYFIIALRNLLKGRGITAINLLGLSLGLAICMLILLFVRAEYSFDRFHQKGSRIYRVTTHWAGTAFGDRQTGFTGLPQGPAFAAAIPEMEQSTRIQGSYRLLNDGAHSDYFQGLYVEDNFLELFSFKLLKGNPKALFQGPNSIVITSRLAERFFNGQDPVGQALEIEGEEGRLTSHVITGLIENAPENSSIRYDFLMPFSTLEKQMQDESDDWSSVFLNTFLLLGPEVNASAVVEKMNRVAAGYLAPVLEEERQESPEFSQSYGLQPLYGLHLGNELMMGNGLGRASNPMFSYILSAAALFILLLASINFINLTLARSMRRSREIGARRVLGGSKLQVFQQFMVESFLSVALAFVPGLALVQWALPWFGELAGKELYFRNLLHPGMLGGLAILLILTSILAGAYPAAILSGLSPLEALAQRIRVLGRVSWARGLAVFQFALAVVFVLLSVAMSRQLDYMLDKRLGYNDQHLMGIDLPWSRSPRLIPLLDQELAGVPQVAHTTARDGITRSGKYSAVGAVNEGQELKFGFGNVGPSFLPTFQVSLLEGRNFSTEYQQDTVSSVLVNASFVKEAGWEQPLGKTVTMNGEPYTVIGVIGDFHTENLSQPIQPLLLYYKPGEPRPEYWLRYEPGREASVMAALERACKKLMPNRPFNFFFLEEELQRQYETERQLRAISAIAAGVAVLIACLGLLGLGAIAAEQRAREMGIRKVFGASTARLVAMLSGSFVRLAFLALLFGLPAAWLLSRKFLQNFAYRVSMGWYIFAGVAALTLLLAFLTVSLYAWMAARRNPAEALRYE